jgi:hypothetical protein
MYQLSSIANALPSSTMTISSVATPMNTQNGTTQLMEQVRNGKISPAVLGGMIAGIILLILIVSLLGCICSPKGQRRVKTNTRNEVSQRRN